MRHFLLYPLSIFLFSAISYDVLAQKKAPKAVKRTFKKMYPNENDPDWRVDKNDYYESHFKKKGIHYRADFLSDGTWIETENNIKKKNFLNPS
ncbi:hypothetical protein [Aquimarina agarivorans]|uniref:hypothetical protein n=1 Tax=Aquimarina agarivorans TaxID=980584 RepID=UPI000248FAE5|nr:hypothetical protein [Aquimarina agarivorans]